MTQPKATGMTDELLVAYLDGELTPSEVENVERHRAESMSTDRRLSTLQMLRAAFAAPLPDLTRRQIVLRVAPTSSSNVQSRFRDGLKLAWPLSIAATLVLGFGLSSLGDPVGKEDRTPSPVEYRARSAAPSSGALRWTGIQVYRMTPSEVVERVHDTLSRADGLIFSYTNASEKNYAYLMIFGKDAHNGVYWMYPSAPDGVAPSRSIPIERGKEVRLPDVIWPSFLEGPVDLYAVFSAKPLAANVVEGWLRTNDAATAPTSESEVVVARYTLTVE